MNRGVSAQAPVYGAVTLEVLDGTVLWYGDVTVPEPEPYPLELALMVFGQAFSKKG
ncbi:MAG: hypothetical protein QXN86_02760 [Candidatus Methanomethylicaceae archaeon]